MTTRAQVAAEARRWLGTPFHHQGRTQGVGCDCGGLVGGVAVALGIVPSDWWERVFDPLHAGYSRTPGAMLQQLCESFMQPAPEMQVGDVLLMRFADEPQHLAIAVDYRHGGLALVHALGEPVGRVVEHRFDTRWRARVARVYRMPGIA